jgi:preprotein translocase subunit SecF
MTKGLNYGIDFSGGILIEAKMERQAEIAQIRHILSALDVGEVSLQTFGDGRDIMIRVGSAESSEEQTRKVNLIKDALAKAFTDNKIEYRKVDFVGPQVGSQLIKDGIWATILSFAAIMVYIWARFEWQYGAGLILALIHDAILTLGFISAYGLEFNLTSIAAILTVIGYSVNDSVVIYDRIRENVRKYRKLTLEELLNLSINNTLSRTILTVLVTLLAVLALILYGGEAVRSFSLTVFFGIVAGTYSSICVSAPILIYLLPNARAQQ